MERTLFGPGGATEAKQEALLSALSLLGDVLAQDDTLQGRYGGGKQAFAGVISTAGFTEVITPAPGKRIRIFWVYALANPTDQNTPLITVMLGSTPVYTGFAISHWEEFTGAVDEPVLVELSSSTQVAVTVHFQEI